MHEMFINKLFHKKKLFLKVWFNVIIMRKIILFFLSSLPCLLFAQTTHVVLEGKVTDFSHNSIAYATVQNIGTDEGTNADTKGKYILKITLPATLKASFIGYKTVLKKISPEAGKDTIQVDFVLALDSAQLQQVEITATQEPQIIRESGSLIDFDISNGSLLLLYQHSHGDLILAYDTNMHKLIATQLKWRVENLQRDERLDIYYAHHDSLYFLYYNPNSSAFEQFSLSQVYFNSFEPVKAFNPPCYYYGKKMEMNAGVQYAFYNSKSKEQKVFYTYFDPNIISQNSEREQEMKDLENKISQLWMKDGGIKARTYEGSLRNLSVLGSDFYSQISVVNDSIYIFNFDNDSINVYDNNNDLIRKFPLLFDPKQFRVSHWEIITNDNKKECYLKYEKNGITYLRKIELNSGRVCGLQVMKYSFIEKLRIFDNYAYYTTLSGGGSGEDPFVRHLYRQKL